MFSLSLKNKWKKIPESVKTSVAFIFSSFVIKGISFLTTPIFTRILNINDYGVITTYNSWLLILEVFATLGLTSAGIFNVGLNDNKKTRDEFISSCIGLCNISTLITFTVIIIYQTIFNGSIGLDTSLVVVMLIHYIVNPAQVFWVTRQRYEYKYKLVTLITIVSVILSQALSILCISLFNNNPSFGKILGNELGIFLFTVPIYYMLISRGKEYINFKRWKTLLLLSIPLIPHYLSQHIMSSSDKIMLSNMVGNDATAIYGVVSNMALIGTIFWNAINATIIPYTYKKIEEKRPWNIRKITKILLISYAIILVGMILVAPEIMQILAPKEYHQGIYCIPPLMFMVFMQAPYNLFANIEFYNKKTKGIANATIVATTINVILNYLLIPKFGYIAASYTTLISYIVLTTLHYLNYRKCKDKVYDSKFILLLSLIFLLIVFISNYFYNLDQIPRLGLLTIIFTVSAVNIKKIINTFKTIFKTSEGKQ